MAKLSCGTNEKKLELYFDGELKGKALKELEAHLSTCPVCQDKIRSLQALKENLGKYFSQELTESGVKGTFESIEDYLTPVPAYREIPRRIMDLFPRLIPRLVPAIASLMVAVLLTGLLLSMRGPLSTSPTPNECEIDYMGSEKAVVMVYKKPAKDSMTVIWLFPKYNGNGNGEEDHEK